MERADGNMVSVQLSSRPSVTWFEEKNGTIDQLDKDVCNER